MEYEANFELNNNNLELNSVLCNNKLQADLIIDLKPSKVSELQNDLNYQTKEQVEELIEENALDIQGSSLIDVTKNEKTVTIISRTYTHEQEIASAAWVITHNLNKKPSVTVVDTAEEVQVPDNIEYNNLNTITLHFLAAFKGKAYLN